MSSTNDATVIAAGKFLQLLSREGWEFVHRPNITGIVAVVAITDAREMILVEQYRIPVAKKVIEIPAGLAGDIEDEENESLETAAARELREEAGYTALKMEFLTQGPPSAGMSTEEISFFRARGLKKESHGGGDESEEITVHLVPLDTIDKWLKQREQQGCLVDPKVYTALYFAGKP
ncbi:MAG TPA: NUDIX hydrolase [Planctomycetota bacterium]|jgi:ADP-ribose pyrophosphatase|nr:NUDIX hydrolase [Planctomycetota bacterium]